MGSERGHRTLTVLRKGGKLVTIPQARASLQALASLDAGLVLPGHRDPFHGAVADAVAQARQAPS
jgi:hypothetical protein